jgi:hypothetical protein
MGSVGDPRIRAGLVRRGGPLLLCAALLPACSEGLQQEGGGPTGVALQAPADLHAEGRNEIRVSWRSEETAATGFRLEVHDGPFGAPPYLDVILLPPQARDLLYPGLPGRTLRFRLYAVDLVGQSPPSNEVEVVLGNFPQTPAHFTALPLGPRTVDLQWVASGSGLAVLVRRSLDAGASWTTVWHQGAPTGSFPFPQGATLTDQAADREAIYELTLENAEGTSVPVRASARTPPLDSRAVRVATAEDDAYRLSACAADGTLHVAHYDATNGNLGRIAWRPGSAPAVSLIDGPGGFWPGIPGWHGTASLMDPGGRLHVAAHEYGEDRLRSYLSEAGAWSAVGVDAAATGRDPRLAQGGGRIWLASRRGELWGSGGLLVAERAGGGWVRETRDENVPFGPFSIAAGAQGQLVVAYVRLDESGLFLARRAPEGTWRVERLTERGAPRDSAVVLDPAGRAHVAWHDAGTGELWYATDAAGVWSLERVHRHTRGNLGAECSLAMAVGARVSLHLAYRNSVNDDLWYARRFVDETEWDRKLIDSAGDVGRYPVVAVDGVQVYLAWRDAGRGDLKLLFEP